MSQPANVATPLSPNWRTHPKTRLEFVLASSIALPRGVMCPKPGRQTLQTPQYGTNPRQLPPAVAGKQIAILPIPAPPPYSDGVSRRFRRSLLEMEGGSPSH
jgi:hypothetical protein